MSDDRATASLERDMEEARERLAATIDQLIYRASPKTLAQRRVAEVRGRVEVARQDAKGYFVDARGNPRTDNILKVAGGVAGVAILLVLIRRVSS